MAASRGSLHEADLPAAWYDQRACTATDRELAGVLAHNRDEEAEHAAMTLEWLRRHDPKIDEMLRTHLSPPGRSSRSRTKSSTAVYLEESFAVRINAPEAAVSLVHG